MTEPIYAKKCRFGMGVFATRNIKKGEKICFMKGDRINLWWDSKLSKSKRNSVDLLQTGDRKYICMKKPYVLVNHSCNPNAAITGVNKLVAIKNISKDQEIFYDYSTVWDDGFFCRCGNKNCRGYISDFFSLPKRFQNVYVRNEIIPNFIKKKYLERKKKA